MTCFETLCTDFNKIPNIHVTNKFLFWLLIGTQLNRVSIWEDPSLGHTQDGNGMYVQVLHLFNYFHLWDVFGNHTIFGFCYDSLNSRKVILGKIFYVSISFKQKCHAIKLQYRKNVSANILLEMTLCVRNACPLSQFFFLIHR